MDINNNGVDDLQELRTFINQVGTDLLEDAQQAWAWLKDELAKLLPEALTALKAAILQAVQEATAGKTIGEIVADVLTILYRDFQQFADQIRSDVVSALVGLTTVPKTA